MREQLTAIGQSVSTQARAAVARLAPAIARVSPVIERARTAGSAGWTGVKQRVVPALRWTGRQSKRAAIGTLLTVENVLLSPNGRDRVHAVTVFALIFGFAVMSVDMIITGGPELIPSAQASSMGAPRVDLIASASTSDGAALQLAEADVSAPAVEPERNTHLRQVSLTSAAPPRAAAPVADLLDAAEPLKAAPVARESVDTPVKADGAA
jgi:hypothetical protein